MHLVQETKHISLVDTAKLVRAALKKAFPTTKFAVRSKSYSGGSSITVSWDNGPVQKAVDAVVGRFEGAEFDGTQDLKTYKDSELDGQPVHFGADYVITNRNYTDFDAQVKAVEVVLATRLRLDEKGRFGNYTLEQQARFVLWAIDMQKDVNIEEAVDEVIRNSNSARLGGW